MICAVIPTYNSEASLQAVLKQLSGKAQRIVVSDGGSKDQTLRTAVKHKAIIAMGASGRGAQLKRGAQWADACDWLLILHADSGLPENWQELVERHIRESPHKAGYFDLRFDNPSLSARIIEALVRARCALFGLPYGDQGLLIAKSLYSDVGGFPETPLFEDVAIIKALGKKRIKRLGGRMLTDALKFERDGFFRRGWRNFRLLRRYLGGESAGDISKDYA